MAQYEITNVDTAWHDEFNGTAVDETNWTFQLGDGTTYGIQGWGNNELQYYQKENATVNGGFLTITAKEEAVGGLPYTSTRMNTANFNNFTYGRFEMRAKMPIGKGMWPAFWLLFTGDGLDGTGIGEYGGWAASGEIDIMEYLGDKPNEVFGTIHYGQEFPGNVFTGIDSILDAGTFNDDFHVFAVEWEPGEIRWYVDEGLYAVQTIWWSEGGPFPAPFDQNFHIILNLAVGGNLPGSPDASTVFPQEMVVDYIRVLNNRDLPTVSLAVDDPTPAAGGGIIATATPVSTLGVEKVELFQGELKVGEFLAPPFDFSLSNLTEGSYKLRAVVTDINGNVNYSNIVDVTVGAGGQGPYGLYPSPIPGVIEAELYDTGGNGVAYSDLDPDLNRGSKESLNTFRSNEGVDIQPTTDMGGGSVVGFIENGEYTEYTVNVAEDGLYDVTIRLSAETSTGTLRLLFDGVDKSGPINFIPSGDFGTYIDVLVTGLDLTAGNQVMRLAFEGTGMTVNKMTFTEIVPPKEIVFDDMEHGDPSPNNNGWFYFGGGEGGGTFGPTTTDLPPKNGGIYALSSSWTSNNGGVGFFGGFGRTNPTDLTDATHFNFWINPAVDEIYNLEINLQDDDNGDNDAPFPLVADDEFWYILGVGGDDSEVTPGGGWQLVSIPFTDFVDKNPNVGNDILDGIPTSEGGNGALINVVIAVVTETTTATFNTDYWVFTDRPVAADIAVDPMAYDFGAVRAGICTSKPFVIANEGICDLVITAINVTGTDAADFSSTNSTLPLTIPAGSREFIQVTFSPSSAGAKSAALSIVSNDPDENPLEVPLSGMGENVTDLVFDDIEHGDATGNGWFFESGGNIGGVGGGGGGATTADVAPENGGTYSLETGWGSGNVPGFFGVFGRNFSLDLSGMEFFSIWVNPFVAGQEYTIEINFQEDDNANGSFDPGLDDEFQFNLKVGGADADLIPGGGWQRVIIPLSELSDDNGFSNGGDGIFNPFSFLCGGNGELISIVFAIVSEGSDANVRIDNLTFLSELEGPDIDAQPSPLAFGDVFVDNCAIKTLTISNIGGESLDVSELTFSGDGMSAFSILAGDAPFTVAPGSFQEVDILFTPTSPGNYSPTLTITSNDPDEGSLEVSVTATGTDDAIIVFDDMEHGNPTNGANGWFQYGGDPNTGGGFGPVDDVPPVAGGSFAMVTGWGGANPGIYGGFGRTFPTNIVGTTHFNMWIKPFDPDNPTNFDQEYILQIQLQEDDNGDDAITPADDEEYQYNLKVGGDDAEVLMNGEWQLISIPLSDFFKDTGFLTGGNGVFDPLPVACGGNGQLIAIAVTVQGIAASQAANFRTDYWSFSNGPLEQEIVASPDPLVFGDITAGSCAEETVTISNPGFADLEVTEVMITGDDADVFSIQSGGDPFTLAPGEMQDIVILFTPEAEEAFVASLRLGNNDSENNPLIVALMGTGIAPGTLVFDDMEHGNPTPGNNGWFQFGGDPDTGGGYGPIADDLPPSLGGTTALVSGWGGANPGIYGGFGRNFPLDVSQSTHFNFWINPLDPTDPSNMDQEFILQIQLQEDDNGDGTITPDVDDEFQYNLKVGGDDADVKAGGGWQFVSIPLSEFFYDNSFLFGGNQVFDPVSPLCGGNGELIAIAITVQGIAPNQAANFRLDYLAFSAGELGPEIDAKPNPVAFGEVTLSTCGESILTIENKGAVPLEIEAMNFMGIEPTPFYILSGDAPVTILPNETHEVVLGFNPPEREEYEDILQIISNDPNNSEFESLLMGTGVSQGVVVFDNMEHGDPFGNGWFAFGGAVGGGGIDPNFVDLPPSDGGSASLQTGWGSGGTAGIFGGFGRTSSTDIGPATNFSFWINPDAGQEYIITIQLQDDDNGDDMIPFPPTGEDDEFQYDLKVGGPEAEVFPGKGWQYVSIPLEDFYDDNSFLPGGNGIFDPVPVSCGGNGQLIAVIFGIESVSGADVTFRTDFWSFSSGPAVTSFILVDADTDTEVTEVKEGDTFTLDELPENFNLVAVVEGNEEINRVFLDLNGPVENERFERVFPYAVFGDNKGNFNGRPKKAGMYDITATPFFIDGELMEGGSLTVNFEIIDCDVEGDMANAGPKKQLDCDTGTAMLEGSVMQGPLTAPFMVEWSGPSGFSSTSLTPEVTLAGIYTLTITGGITGCVSTDEVLVEPCAETCEPQVSGFILVNAKTDEDIRELTTGAVIDLTQDGRDLSIRAKVLCGDKVKSVKLELRGAQVRDRTENVAPYSLTGDIKGDYRDQEFRPGDYSLEATPFTERNGQGAEGISKMITFTVTNGEAAVQSQFGDPSLNPDYQLSIFPIPTAGELYLDMKFFEEGIYEVVLFDIAGRTVMDQRLVYDEVTGKRFTVKTQQLADGVYMLRLSGQEYQEWRKISINR
ncbi:MAG: choice-of-anchor D domain-containing protein [Bacteroidota bacterium]